MKPWTLRRTTAVVATLGAAAATATWLSAQDQTPTLFAFVRQPAGTQLARFDPVALAPIGDAAPILEYHYHAALSPDGSRIAVAIGAPQIGSVRIVNTSTMNYVTTRAGIAAESVVWLDNDRLAAALQCVPTNLRGSGCALVLIDANSGDIIERWPATESDRLLFEAPLDVPKPAISTRFGALFLLGHVGEGGAMLALVNPQGALRLVPLERINSGRPLPERFTELAHSFSSLSSGGLAVNAAGNRAFVIGGDPTVAEISLDMLAVTYHDIPDLPRMDDAYSRRALWLGDRHLIVYGTTFNGGRRSFSKTPEGVRLIDTTTWRVEMLEPDAAAAAAYGTTSLSSEARCRA